jgi:hypothetical protein
VPQNQTTSSITREVMGIGVCVSRMMITCPRKFPQVDDTRFIPDADKDSRQALYDFLHCLPVLSCLPVLAVAASNYTPNDAPKKKTVYYVNNVI